MDLHLPAVAVNQRVLLVSVHLILVASLVSVCNDVPDPLWWFVYTNSQASISPSCVFLKNTTYGTRRGSLPVAWPQRLRPVTNTPLSVESQPQQLSTKRCVEIQRSQTWFDWSQSTIYMIVQYWPNTYSYILLYELGLKQFWVCNLSSIAFSQPCLCYIRVSRFWPTLSSSPQQSAGRDAARTAVLWYKTVVEVQTVNLYA